MRFQLHRSSAEEILSCGPDLLEASIPRRRWDADASITITRATVGTEWHGWHQVFTAGLMKEAKVQYVVSGPSETLDLYETIFNRPRICRNALLGRTCKADRNGCGFVHVLFSTEQVAPPP